MRTVIEVRGRYGEDLGEEVHEDCGTEDCCGTCDTASTHRRVSKKIRAKWLNLIF